MPVNVTAHTYSVYVTPAGATEVALAANYSWRSEQLTAQNVSYAAVYDDAGSISACNLLINSKPLDAMSFVTLYPAVGQPYLTVVAVSSSPSGGAAQVASGNPTVTSIPGATYTLSDAVSGNQLLVFTSNAALVTVTVPAGLGANDAFTLLQGGSGVVQVVAGAGVTLTQRRSSLRAAGPGSPVTIQGTGVQNQFVVWGDMQ